MTRASAVFVVEFEDHEGVRKIVGRFPSRKVALESAFGLAEKKCPRDMDPVAYDREGPSIVVGFQFPDGGHSAVYSEAWRVTQIQKAVDG